MVWVWMCLPQTLHDLSCLPKSHTLYLWLYTCSYIIGLVGEDIVELVNLHNCTQTVVRCVCIETVKIDKMWHTNKNEKIKINKNMSPATTVKVVCAFGLELE